MEPSKNFMNFACLALMLSFANSSEVALTQLSNWYPQWSKIGKSTQSVGCDGFRVDLYKETEKKKIQTDFDFDASHLLLHMSSMSHVTEGKNTTR